VTAAWRLLAGLSVVVFFRHAGAADLVFIVHTPTGSPVENAAVVLEPLVGKAPTGKSSAIIEQRDREFVPYVTIVQKGTAVEFPNRDKLKHHVYSFSPAKTFELKLYSGKPGTPVHFDKTGEVALGCNIHDWMEAHVLVVETPWFAKTGNDGRARITQVPAGHYRLRLWHPQQKITTPTTDIDVKLSPQQPLALTLDVAPRPPRPKPPADTGGY
jgi:plastocyanin